MKNLLFAALLILGCMLAFSSCSDETLEGIEQNETIHEHVHDSRSCGHSDHMHKLLSDPAYKTAYDVRMAKFKTYNSTHLETRALCNSPVTIPVAVHYQGVSNPNLGCLTSLAQEAITGLNADMQGANSDITKWTNDAANAFPGVNFGETCVEFVIADSNHPTGYNLSNGDLAVTVNQTNSDEESNWAGYLNIFVIPNTGLLGYAPLGGSGNGDGVVIDASAFGTGTNCTGAGSSAPFNLGRTLTHEVGHYLLLDHIWGNGCGTDDGISDTPNQNSDYGGCPNIGASSCSSTDMHMNYMDYVNDACMYMFTSGQATVMENYIASSLSILTNNASNVISGNGGGTGGGNGGGNGGSTCTTPTGLNSQVLSSTSAKITWTAEAQATNYQVRFRASGTSGWTSVTTTIAEATLTGLIASTTYQFQLRAQCPAGYTSFTTTSTFTTTSNGGGNGGNGSGTCDKPSFSSVTYVSTNRSKATWETMPDAIRYRIAYRKQGTSSWTTKSSTTPTKNLFNLTYGATYEYKVRTKCPTGWTGYTGIETFVQSSGSGGNGGGNGGSCSDNTIKFEITLDVYGSETTWELVNENGQSIANGGPYADNQSGTKKTKTFCIPDGCYTLYVDDAYGDGICCDYGNGSFELFDINNTSIGSSDGNFGYYDYLDFCVTDNVASFSGERKDEKATNLKAKDRPADQN